MRAMRPERGLERLLYALERDVIDATDEEILAAARGSAAFFGVTVLARFRGLPRKATRRKRLLVASRCLPKDDAPPST